MAFGGQLSEVVTVTHQDRVVTAFKQRWARDVVIGGRSNKSDAAFGEFGPHLVDDAGRALGEFVEEGRVVGAVAAVVHAQHGGEHGGPVVEHVALEPGFQVAASAASDAVATPTGVRKAYRHFGKARDHKGFDEGGVEALVGDAVTVENDAVPGSQVESVVGAQGQGREGKSE